MSDPLDQDNLFASTVVERYLARSSHGTGMVFDAMFQFACDLDSKSLATAWMQTLSMHPRLHATLRGRGKSQHWAVETIEADRFFFEGSNVTPNIRQGRGAVLIVGRSAAKTRLHFRFHHAACDGVGAARIVGDFFKYLTNRNDPVASASAAPSNEYVNESGCPSPVITPDLRNSWATIRGRNVRFSKHVVTAKRPLVQEPAPGWINDTTLAIEFDEDLSLDLRRRLRQRKIPLNDFAVAAAMCGLSQLSQNHAANRTHVMIMNPVQMRSYRQRRMSSNHLGFAFIRRQHGQLGVADPECTESAIDSIHQELRRVRDHGIAGELSWGIGLLESVPLSLRAIERLGWFTPTASVTCLSSIRFARRYGLGLNNRHAVSQVSKTAGETGRSRAALKWRVTDFALGSPLQSGGELAITVWDLGGRIGWSFRTAEVTDATTSAVFELAEFLRDFANRACSLSLQSRLKE